jgi:hypothetical protein
MRQMSRRDFFDTVRADLFDGRLTQSQVDGMEGIIAAMAAVGDNRDKTLAYALATAYHETGRRMEPVREGFAASDEEAIQAVARLAEKRGPSSAPSRYGKPAGPHGKTYYGRGYVQLTWLENYQRSSADAGHDLVRHPDKMLDPEISARVLIRGLLDGRWNGAQGKGLADYLPSDGEDDLKGARRTVNVTDKWKLIAGYYDKFLAAIRTAGGLAGLFAEAPSPGEPSAPPTPRPEPLPRPRPRPEDDAAQALADWVARCPGDIVAIGNWLAECPAAPRTRGKPKPMSKPARSKPRKAPSEPGAGTGK